MTNWSAPTGPSLQKVDQDPTETFECKLLLKKSALKEEVCRRTIPQTQDLRGYGLPTIHKESIPLTPIVSNIGAHTYKLSKYMAGLLSPFVGHCVAI